MAGYNHRGMVFREVEPFLSDEDLAEVKERERQEVAGNIPKHDHLRELYQEFEWDNMEHMRILTGLIGMKVALMESASPEMQDIARSLIEHDQHTIELLRENILPIFIQGNSFSKSRTSVSSKSRPNNMVLMR
jgi:hypothetical protein